MLTRRGLCVGCFRVRHCEKATELQAVETLLISDELFRYVWVCVYVRVCVCMGVCMYACVCKGIGSVLYQSCSGVCVCIQVWDLCSALFICVCVRVWDLCSVRRVVQVFVCVCIRVWDLFPNKQVVRVCACVRVLSFRRI